MKEKYQQRQAKIQEEQRQIKEILSKQVMAVLSGDQSFLSNQTIPTIPGQSSLSNVSMLVGGKINIEKRSQSITAFRQQPPSIIQKLI